MLFCKPHSLLLPSHCPGALGCSMHWLNYVWLQEAHEATIIQIELRVGLSPDASLGETDGKKIKKSPLLALLLPLCCPPTNIFPDFLPRCSTRNSICTLLTQFLSLPSVSTSFRAFTAGRHFHPQNSAEQSVFNKLQQPGICVIWYSCYPSFSNIWMSSISFLLLLIA